jgi:Secretion system C-terminal sorting domain
MKKILSLIALLAMPFMASSQSVTLADTDNPLLDGVYQKSSKVNGFDSYIKNTAVGIYIIYKYAKDGISAWLIEDKKGNTYFGSDNEDIDLAKAKWNIGRAGNGLNPDFSIFVNEPKKEDITLKKNVQSFESQSLKSEVISIYPNPTISEINIEIGEQVEKISVLNVSGSVVLISQNTRFSVVDLTAGTYFISIKTKENSYVKKFVKK